MMLPKYDLIEHKNSFHDDHWAVKILDGEYEGLVYQYDIVKFNESEGEDGADITFNTITLDNPNNADLTEENDKGILGAVLVDIIQQQLEQMSENGTPDSEEPTT
jgi:hypothetical protein